MPDGYEAFSTQVVERLADVPRDAWDACAGAENPFVSFDFLSCLEDSASVSPATGWTPRHIVLKDRTTGQILACAPVYLKGHSMGEYVFDWGWAEAYERAGGKYYPKLLCAVPFTPASGPRLLVRGDLPEPLRTELKRQLAGTLAGLAERAQVSSIHINFVGDSDA
ncbi:MAG: GNAT family N-acetyltransferase, partial [Rhodospirillales bacterium]|nr:GNAT family N-acetyltransferase [Rhodospirillales bacterium]